MPDSISSFRAAYRQTEIGPRYSGWGHFLFTTLASLTVIAVAGSQLHHVKAWEWATVPVAFVIANFAEYLAHRFVMHVPRPGLGLVYKRHTLQHHHFFTEEALAAESSRDFKMVLFPPVLLLFFFGGLATPIGALLYYLVSPNCGILFAMVGMGYFLTYEWLHLAYHQPESSWVLHVPLVRGLRTYHGRHHDLGLMGRYNYNLVFPLADRVCGTRYAGGPRPRGA